MKLSRRNVFKRLLLATLAATSLTWCDVVHAEDASGNNIAVNEHSQDSTIYGGRADMDNGTASDNIVTINNGNFRQIYGGTGQNAINNQVIINGGTVDGSNPYFSIAPNGVTGGMGYITVNNDGVGNQVSGNIITIKGGTIIGRIEGGSLYFDKKNGSRQNSFITNNTINIYGNPNLADATLYGKGGFHRTDGISGNLLNLATQITAQNIHAFDNINFFIPKTMTNGGTMLTLTSTDGTNLSGTAIRAAMQGGSTLDTGDTVTLIQSAGTITTDSTTTYGKMSQAEYDAIKDRLPSGMLSDGVSLNYEMTVEKSGDNAIVARIGNTTDSTSSSGTSSNGTSSNGSSSSGTSSSGSSSSGTSSSGTSSGSILNPGKLLPQTDLIAKSTVYPTLHLASYMSDKLVDWLPPRSYDFEDEDEELPDTPIKDPKGFEVFIAGGGGSFRNKTGDGSYIDSTVKGFDIGLGRSLEYASGPLVFAPIFEYATGDYDSYLADGTHGRGNTKYIAGGLIGRKTFNSGLYIEASARGGKTERDFYSDTMISNGAPTFVHYDKTSAPIFAGHLRIGKQLRLNKNNLLDVYGIYFHAHQGSMNLTLSTGEDYHFASANAAKTRLGYRLTTRTSKISRIYTGLAFQYEHTSDAVGIYKGRRTPGGGNHGASGMLELGWMIKPNKTNPWMLDLNATGFVGHQKGVSATLKLQKEF